MAGAAGAVRGWVLYDDACGFCRRWVPFWQKTLGRRGFAIATLQAPWVAERLPMTRSEIASDLRLVLVDGTAVQGADVYRYVMRRIWWAYPLFLLASAPILRRLFDWGYRTFADNRYRISKTCRLPPGPTSGS
jgi:predicted DCC family thiol-disulfide oxidoreductase YuxK